MLKPDGSQGPGNRYLARCLDEARKRKAMVRIRLVGERDESLDRKSWVVRLKKDSVVVICYRLWKIGELINAGPIRRMLRCLMGRYYQRAHGFPLGAAPEYLEIPLSKIRQLTLPADFPASFS